MSKITSYHWKISPICDFLFGSIRTNLPTDTVHVELTVWRVKGSYTYRKDYTMESMIFTPWSKKVTPFPCLRHKVQTYQDNQGSEKVLQWGNTFQFSACPVTQTNPRKRVCKRFGLSCQFCKQSVPHPSPQESGWTDEDWTGGHTQTQKPAG